MSARPDALLFRRTTKSSGLPHTVALEKKWISTKSRHSGTETSRSGGLERCLLEPVLAHSRAYEKVPRRGLEPLCLAAPDPKSGASANFATSAAQGHPRGPHTIWRLWPRDATGECSANHRAPPSRTRAAWLPLARKAIATPCTQQLPPGLRFSRCRRPPPLLLARLARTCRTVTHRQACVFQRLLFPQGAQFAHPLRLGQG